MTYETQKNKINILSTAPLSRQLIEQAAKYDIVIDERSFIETKLVEDKKITDKIEGYIQQDVTAVFTSMNAVNAIVKHLKQSPRWKIYCVGNTTKKLIVDYFGRDSIKGVAANAAELAEVIIKDTVNCAVFFCGDRRRNELSEKLKHHYVVIDELVVYTTHEMPVLIDRKYDGILFFSPSAVQSFFSVNKLNNETKLFATGSTTAKAIKQYNENTVITPGSPGKENMIREVVEYYGK